MATDRNDHLQKVLDTHDINKVEALSKMRQKKNDVKKALDDKFSDKRASNVMDSGSYAKNTAINTKFDIDICAPYLKKTTSDEAGFETLSEMYDEVYKYLRFEYKKGDDQLKEVRKQKVSIGLLFDLDGDAFEMDVVPARERPDHGSYNSSSTKLSLHINSNRQSDKEKEKGSTRIQTNIKAHVDLLSNKPHERKAVKQLKVWKLELNDRVGGKLIKSFMMELYAKEAFESCDEIPTGMWEKLKMVMQYIIDNIENNDLVDPANSSNIVSDSMSDTAKTTTKRELKKTIKEVEEDSDKIKEYFPINEKYNEGDETKGNSAYTSPSVLSTSTFG